MTNKKENFMKKKMLLVVILNLFLLNAISLGEVLTTEPVVVTAPKNENMNTKIITKDEIELMGKESLSQVINTISGITNVNSLGTIGNLSTISIRGADSEKTIVMIDGQIINDISLGTADIGNIPVDSIEYIEVTKGATFNLYTDNASGGIINIITKRPVSKKLNVNSKITVGSFGTQKIYAGADLAKDNGTNFFFSINNDHCDGYRKRNEFDAQDVNLKLGKKSEKIGDINLSIIYQNSKLEVPGQNYTQIKDYDGKKERKASLLNTNQNDEKWYIQVLHKKNITNNYSVETMLYSNITQRNYVSKEYGYNQNTLTLTNLNGLNFSVHSKYNTTLGIDLKDNSFVQKDKLQNPSKKIQDKTRYNRFAFLEQDLNYKNLSVIAALQAVNDSMDNQFFNPKTSLIYKIDEPIKIFTDIGKSYKVPDFEDLYYSDPYMQGNPNLRSEKIISYDFGTEVDFSSLYFKFCFFKNDVNDKIIWGSDNSFMWKPSNIGKAYEQGLELEIKQQLTDEVSHGMNFTDVENKGKNEGDKVYKTLPYTVPQKLYYWISYKNTGGWKFYVDANYNQTANWEDGWGTEHKLKEYTLVDLNITKTIKQFDLFFTINNLLDQKYQVVEYYPLPGVEYYFGVKVQF
jgi:vitamin B12 transporter